MNIILRSLAIFIVLYLLITYTYYYSFKGNDQIKFIKADTISVKTFGDIFKENIFTNKVTFVDMFFNVNNPDCKSDLPYFKKLADKYHNQPFQILYTNDGSNGFFDNIEQKKGIIKNDLFGYHMTVPPLLEITMEVWQDARHSIIPRYMLVKNNIIVDTFATQPSNYNKLCIQIDSLLKE
jgi:thiol-disulfide isomerase/thioredoxin